MNEERGKIYFIGGVNGVGKTTFLEELASRYPDIEVVHGSGALMKWLGIQPGDYDGLRNFPDDLKNIETGKMIQHILRERKGKGKILIIDAHYFHYKRGELVDTTGEWMTLLDTLWMITAPAEVILARVEKNEAEGGKLRDLFPLDINSKEGKLMILNNFLAKTLEKAQEISKRYNIPCFVINNGNEGIGSVIEEFLYYHTFGKK